MEKRRHEIAEPFAVTPHEMFDMLITPSAIRGWFGASKAIVEPREGGSWITSWGESEHDSDHVNSFKILEFEPPKRMLLGSGRYFAESNWPLETNITTELIVEPQPTGCVLRITQELDPADPLLDDYFDACVAGWQNVFEGIRNYLHVKSTE